MLIVCLCSFCLLSVCILIACSYNLCRPTNTSILTRNFKADYEGMVGTKVLEDEMYMSEILEMSVDVQVDWRKLPISELPAINIHWEYGVCFPLARYPPDDDNVMDEAVQSPNGSGDEDNDDDNDNNDMMDSSSSASSAANMRKTLEQIVERVSGVPQCAMFLHPTRYSMMLWAMDGESRRTVEEAVDLLPDDWMPTMVLAHEFSLLPCLYPHGYPDHARMHHLVAEGTDEDEEEDGEGDVDLLLTPSCSSIQDMQNRYRQ